MTVFLELIGRAIETEPHHGLTLADNTYVEGYILDYAAEWLVFGAGGPLAAADRSICYSRAEIRLVWFIDNGSYVAHPL